MTTRVAFAGSPEFAATILERLISAGWDIPLVISQPDAPAGRGQALAESAVSRVAKAHQLPLATPATVAEITDRLQKADVDLLIVAAYGQIIPETVFSIPRHGTLNIHASLLPKYRGASPVSAAIIAGDQETGISLMQIEAGLDTGPVYAQATLPIAPTDSTGSMTARLAELGAECLLRDVPRIIEGSLSPTPQDPDHASLTTLLTKADGRIDWTQSAEQIGRHLRAMQPWPGAWTEADGHRLEVITAETVGGTAEPGQMTAEGLVGTGDGQLRLVTVKPAGKGLMPAADWLRGYRDQLPRLT